ncbi:MAG: leucine-rich repeat protein [Anaerovoracaceae bacterium]
MKKRGLFTLLLAICMVVSLIPTVAFANTGEAEAAVATQTSSPKTYTVDVTNSSHKVGVNGGTPVNSQIDSTGIILNPGDKLVWTSTGGKTKRLTGMMDHHGDDNYPYTYSTGVGFKIVKSNASENYKLSDACNIQEKAYKIISGGQTTFGNDGKINNATDKLIYDESKGEAPPTGLEAATVHVDDSMTANVPMLVKATNGGQPGVYYSYCSIHTTCTWNAYYYGVGHTFTVEPLVNTSNGTATASISVNLDEGAVGSGYPTSIPFGNDPITLSMPTPTRTGKTFVGWDIRDENNDTRTFRGLFEERADGSLYYPGLTATNWSVVRNAIGKTIHIKPIWSSAEPLAITFDADGGIVKEVKTKNTHITQKDTFYSTQPFSEWYTAVRPGYDFKGWYLGNTKIEKITDIPTQLWNPNEPCEVKAKWERNNDTESFVIDSSTKKLTILDNSFFDFNDKTYATGWQEGIEELEITKNVTKISDRAFVGYAALPTVVVPNTVKEIGYSAFVYMDSLKSAYVPSSVTSIGNVEPLFGYCSNGSVTVYCEAGSDVEKYAQEMNAPQYNLYNPYIIHYAIFNDNGTIELIHDWNDGTVTDEATETESGTKKLTCTKCGATEEVEVPATGHTWNGGEVTKAATATETGIKTYTCTNQGCDATTTAVIPVKGHTHTWNDGVVTKAATATETGIKTYSCTGCSETKTEDIPATGASHVHSWNAGVITKDATTTEAGIKLFTCTSCGGTNEVAIPAHEHVWDAGVVTQEPTETEQGVRTYTCTFTGCGKTKQEAIDATGSSGGNDPSTGESSGNTGGLTGGTTAPSVPADNTITNSGSEAAGNSSTNVNLSDKTTVSGDKAETTVDSDLGNKIVENAVENKATEVVIKAETSKGDSTGASVTLPAETVQAISEKTEATVTIETDSASISLDQDALAAVAAQAGTTGEVKLIVEIREQNKNKVEVDLKIVTDKGTVSDFNGGNVTVSVPVDKELATKKLVCVYIDDNGHMSKVKGQMNADGTFTFTTGHFSTYAILAEEEADAAIAEQKEAIKNIGIKLTSKQVKTKSGKEGIKITWTAAAGDKTLDGIEIYRSTERYKGYGTKPFYATKNGKTEGYYINTKSLKAGTRYYYRVRGYVLVDGQKVYTDYSNKAWRTVK